MLTYKRIRNKCPPCHYQTQTLWYNLPRNMKGFYTRIGHLLITNINNFFNVGVCGSIIFSITFITTAFKLNLQSNILAEGMREVLIPKASYLKLMIMHHLFLFTNLVAVGSRYIVACKTIVINILVIHLSIKV